MRRGRRRCGSGAIGHEVDYAGARLRRRFGRRMLCPGCSSCLRRMGSGMTTGHGDRSDHCRPTDPGDPFPAALGWTAVTRLTKRVERLIDIASRPVPQSCETCWGWTLQVVVNERQPPRGEDCPVYGRRVPIRLIRVYLLVDLDGSEAGEGSAESPRKVVPITRE